MWILSHSLTHSHSFSHTLSCLSPLSAPSAPRPDQLAPTGRSTIQALTPLRHVLASGMTEARSARRAHKRARSNPQIALYYIDDSLYPARLPRASESRLPQAASLALRLEKHQDVTLTHRPLSSAQIDSSQLARTSCIRSPHERSLPRAPAVKQLLPRHAKPTLSPTLPSQCNLLQGADSPPNYCQSIGLQLGSWTESTDTAGRHAAANRTQQNTASAHCNRSCLPSIYTSPSHSSPAKRWLVSVSHSPQQVVRMNRQRYQPKRRKG